MAQPRSAISNAVKASKPASGVRGAYAPKPIAKGYVGVKGSPQVPQVSQKGGTPQGLAGANANVAAGTNVPAAAAPGSVSPWDTDPISQSKFVNANTNYENALAFDTSNREGLVNNYGWAAVDPSGNAINPVYSPFSIASLLQRTHDINRRGAVNGAGLNLYSGATTSHLQQADFRYGQEEHSKRSEFEEGLGKIKLNEQEALEGKQGAEEEGKTGAVERAGQEPDPVVPEAGPNLPGLGGDSQHPKAYKAGVGAGKEKPKAPPGYHAYKGPDNQWWYAPN